MTWKLAYPHSSTLTVFNSDGTFVDHPLAFSAYNTAPLLGVDATALYVMSDTEQVHKLAHDGSTDAVLGTVNGGASYSGSFFDPAMYAGGVILRALDGASNPAIVRVTFSPFAVTVLPIDASTLHGLALSPDGSRLAVVYAASPYLRVYDTATWATVAGVPAVGGGAPYGGSGWFTTGLCYSPDGGTLVYHDFSTNTLRAYNTTTWAQRWSAGYVVQYGSRVEFSADGSLVSVVNCGNVNTSFTNSPSPTVLSASTGTPVFSADLWAYSATFVEGSALLAYDSKTSATTQLIDASTGVTTGAFATSLYGYGVLLPTPAPPAPVTQPFWTHFINTAETI